MFIDSVLRACGTINPNSDYDAISIYAILFLLSAGYSPVIDVVVCYVHKKGGRRNTVLLLKTQEVA